jgi:hypothetical protein
LRLRFLSAVTAASCGSQQGASGSDPVDGDVVTADTMLGDAMFFFLSLTDKITWLIITFLLDFTSTSWQKSERKSPRNNYYVRSVNYEKT